MEKKGWIEAIVGCMFCGKSEELMRRIDRAKIAEQKVQVFKHSLDTRYGENYIVAHSGGRVKAVGVKSSEDIIAKIAPGTQVVAIDEGQFFSDGLSHVAKRLANEGRRVIVAGLDLNFRGEPFGPMPVIMAMAEEVLKLTAICMVCKGKATKTQRIINGRPASYNDPEIIVGAKEKYEARCKDHHVVLNEPP